VSSKVPAGSLAERLRLFLPTVYKKYGALNARQYAYRAEAAKVLKKSRTTFNQVNRILVELREQGVLPWNAVLDSSRDFSPLLRDDSPESFILRERAKFVRLAEAYYVPKWRGQPIVPVLITEKEGLIPYFETTTQEWDVSIYPIKGQAGKSHLHANFRPWAIRVLQEHEELRVIYLGDYDDEGFQIEQTLNETLASFGVPIETVRLALTKELVEQQGIELEPCNPKSSISGKFVEGKAELEALEPTLLTQLVEEAIRECIDEEILADSESAEPSEQDEARKTIKKLTRGWD